MCTIQESYCTQSTASPRASNTCGTRRRWVPLIQFTNAAHRQGFSEMDCHTHRARMMYAPFCGQFDRRSSSKFLLLYLCQGIGLRSPWRETREQRWSWIKVVAFDIKRMCSASRSVMAFKNKHIFTISGKHTATAQASHTASYYHDVCILLSCATTVFYKLSLVLSSFKPGASFSAISKVLAKTKGTTRTPRKGKSQLRKLEEEDREFHAL